MKSLIGFGSVSTFAQPAVTGVILPLAPALAMASAKEPAGGAKFAPTWFGSSAPLVSAAYLVIWSLPAARASHSLARSLFLERSAIARFEPPRKTVPGLSAVLPGIGK